MKTLTSEARNKGIRLTYDKGGKRVKKTANALLNEIRKHDNKIMRARAEQTKNMILACQSILGNVRPPPKAPPAPPPPPKAPPVMKAFPKAPPPPPPKAPPIMKKMSMMNELKMSLNKKGIKQKLNRNAKISIA